MKSLPYFNSVFIFIFFNLFLLCNVNADIPGTGTVTQITDPSLPSTLYIGKTYYIHAIAKDIAGDPVGGTGCAAESYLGTSITDDTQYIDRELVKFWCKDSKTSISALPSDCFYTTFENGHILIPFYIYPTLYSSGETYTFNLMCEGVTISQVATISGYSEKIENGGPSDGCNVSEIKILDGSGLTVDEFDETPNRFDSLIVPYSLTSFNTVCINEVVKYKVQKEVDGSFLDLFEFKESFSDINGTGAINIPLDAYFVSDGKYNVVVQADDKSDSAEFIVLIPRDPFSPKDIDFFRQPVFMGFVIFIVIFGVILIGFKRSVV